MKNAFVGNLIPTERLYYYDQYLASCDAVITKVGNDYVETDRTVAFPEGGGQEGDHGLLETVDGKQLAFVDTKKGYGRPVSLKDFPSIQVDTPIKHFLEEKDHGLSVGDSIRISIDVERREQLTLSHTASHLLLIAIGKVAPAVPSNIRGCHIATEYARFDFRVEDKFTQEDLAEMKKIVDGWVRANKIVKVFPHQDEPEALYWECDGEVMPCGGTHLETTGSIGQVVVRRRGMGKGKERVMVEFQRATLRTDLYHN